MFPSFIGLLNALYFPCTIKFRIIFNYRENLILCFVLLKKLCTVGFTTMARNVNILAISIHNLWLDSFLAWRSCISR